MKSSDLPFDPLIHEDLVTGKRKAIGWGISGDIYYRLLQAPYVFESLIDGSQGPLLGQYLADIPVVAPEHLLTYKPDQVVIVIFADIHRFGDEICRQIAQFGNYVIQLPYLAVRDEQYLPTIITPSLSEQLQVLMHTLRQNRTCSNNALRISLWIHALVKGGAERQMVLLALGLRQLGWQVQFICSRQHHIEGNHWVRMLEAAGVIFFCLPTFREMWSLLACKSPQRDLARQLAPYFESVMVHDIVTTVDALNDFSPGTIVSYLDDGNVSASMAGLIVGTKYILAAGRNVTPTAFPDLTLYDMNSLSRYYQTLMALPGCHLFNNSTSGAASYADWLGVLPATIPVVTNAVLPDDPLSKRNVREELGLSADTPILLGCMRLSPEKNPQAFVRVACSVIKNYPEAHAVLLGTGKLEAELRQLISDIGMKQNIHMIGVQEDVFSWLSQANLLVSTSRWEGMSNVILEAQAVGCPVVATDVGGTRETLCHALYPYMVSFGDWDLMVEHALSLLKETPVVLSDELREEMRKNYSPETLASKTLLLMRE